MVTVGNVRDCYSICCMRDPIYLCYPLLSILCHHNPRLGNASELDFYLDEDIFDRSDPSKLQGLSALAVLCERFPRALLTTSPNDPSELVCLGGIFVRREDVGVLAAFNLSMSTTPRPQASNVLRLDLPRR